jgi:hypothetical protein
LTRRGRLIALSALLLGIPDAARGGFFERVDIGGRPLALAEAAGASLEDVSAAYWNAAGLSLLPRGEILFTHSRPYVVEGLSGNALALGLPVRALEGGASLYWHRLAVDGVVAENLFGLSAGRWVYRDNRRTLHAGVTAKVAQVAFDEDAGLRDFGSQTRVTGDLSLLLEEGASWRFGAVWRNLGEPDFDFVSQGDEGGADLQGGLVLSTSYRWRPEAGLHLSRAEVGGEAAWNYAGEIWFYEVFAIRAGIHDEEFSGGLGLKGRGWEVDAAFLTDKQLGNSYRASLLLFRPRPREEGGR